MALCQAGDEVIIPTPGWVTHTEQPRLAGASVVQVACSAEHGFLLQPDQLEAAITPATRVVCL